MPIVRIDITGPQTPEHVHAILRGTRASITSSLGVADGRIHLRVVETPASHVDAPACRTVRYTVIDIALYEGRTPELKAACVAAIRAALAADPGIEPSEVAVAFRDMSTLDLDVLPGEADE
ncbi:MAG: tautomerase family protein [Coriobacteriia bacterium]|nr:tautomerase family protein [Coriobacteriia bacterium]